MEKMNAEDELLKKQLGICEEETVGDDDYEYCVEVDPKEFLNQEHIN